LGPKAFERFDPGREGSCFPCRGLFVNLGNCRNGFPVFRKRFDLMETFHARPACPFVDPDKLFEENMNF
jgi:hypothetical protein